MRRLFAIILLHLSAGVLLAAQTIGFVPQEVQYNGDKTLDVSAGIVTSAPKETGRYGLEQRSGAYRVDITAKGIILESYDERGEAYAMMTLEDLVRKAGESKALQHCTIYDWPDIEDRSVADGFDGDDWTHDFRLSMISLAGHLRMSEYVYAPKNDPFVGSPDWIMPYTQGYADQIKELIEACRQNNIDFTWCIRPDKDYTWSEADYSLLLGKFEMMHYMGVRSFGMFLDDVPCPEGEQWRKTELVEKVNADFMKKKGLQPLRVSVDGCYIPQAQGESAKLGMYAYASRAWNKDSYDPYASLEWAVTEIAPDVKEPFIRFVHNSEEWISRFGGGEYDDYRLIEARGYSKEEYDALMEEFKAIENVPAAVSAASNKSLYREVKPWLEEFGKLGTRCRKVLECISLYSAGDIPGFWSTYASNLMSEAEIASYNEYPSGAGMLQPFYERMMDDLDDVFDIDNGARVAYERIEGDGMQTFVAPAGTSACHLIMNNPDKAEVIVRLSDASGRYTAEFCIMDSYFRFDMKGSAVKVEVIGDVPVFETVFVK